MKNQNQSLVKQKLSEFIRKFYLQKLVIGFILTLLQLLAIFLIINYTEYYFWLDKTPRTIIFVGWWCALASLLFTQTIQPAIKLMGHGKRLTNEEAALIIGNHFSEIQDKLLNLLQLEEMNDSSSNELILKSIEQKTNNLSKFTFTSALDWKRFKKQTIKFSLLLIVLVAWSLFEAPKMKAASHRWWNFSEKFVRKAPFNFILLNNDLNFVENESAEIKIKLTGSQLPTSVFFLFEGQKIEMKNEGNQQFSYLINQVKSTQTFAFFGGGFESQDFQLIVNKLPKWKNISLTVQYPAYTQLKTENINPYDAIKVPEGSILSWNIETDDASELYFSQNNSWKTFAVNAKQTKHVTKVKGTGNEQIKAFLKGKSLVLKDTFQTTIEPILDAYPELSIETTQDSSYENLWYFTGYVNDDYGVKNAQFVYRILLNEQDNSGVWKSMSLKINPSKTVEIVHLLNVDLMGLKPQNIIEYYFSAADNDAVNGSKIGKTAVQRIVKKSVDAYREETFKNKQNLQDKMMQSQRSSKKILEESKKIQEDFLKASKMNYDNQSKIQSWIEKQEQQLKEMQKIYEQQKKIDREQKELKLNDPELEQRRDKIEKELKQLQNPDLQKLLEQLRELLDKNAPKEQLENKMKSIDKLQKETQKEMDKLMEQLKELQLEEAVKDQAKQMDEWIKKEEELAAKTEKATQKDKEGLLKELEEQNKKLEDLEKQSDQIEKQNQSLENPMKLDLGQKEQKEAKQESENAKSDVQKGKQKDAAQKEKSAAKKMKEAKEKMEKSLKEEEEKRLAEDHDLLRALLENLIDISHRQEKVFTELKTIKEDNPRLLALNKIQIALKELSSSIEDSLRALAKRQPMVSSLVTKEIGRVNDNMQSALDFLKVRNVAKAAMHGQYVMTGYNNLAVMLMESLKDMNQKMSSQKNSKSNSNKSCNNPNSSGQSGKGKPKKGGKLSEAQKELGEMLQKMQAEGKGKGQGKNDQKSGKGKDGQQGDPQNQPGGNKNGQQGEGGKDGNSSELSKELAQMALMQEALRRQIAELKKNALKEGNVADAQKLAEAEKMMEQQERDIVNGKLEPKTLQRHKDILTRLLEHEKAQMKQGDDEQRKANKGEQMPVVIPLEMIERNKKKLQEKEMLRKTPPNLSPYYKQKVEEYLNLNP